MKNYATYCKKKISEDNLENSLEDTPSFLEDSLKDIQMTCRRKTERKSFRTTRRTPLETSQRTPLGHPQIRGHLWDNLNSRVTPGDALNSEDTPGTL